MNARLPEVSPVPARLALLRDAMVRENLAAYLVPSADPHLSEYLPERWQARRWLSGFTGSVGTLVVTADFAGLWVDSRYWVQADAELAGMGVQLMKMTGGQQSAPHVDWQVTTYSGAPHAFTIPGTDRYRPVADARSWRAMMCFLDEVFG